MRPVLESSLNKIERLNEKKAIIFGKTLDGTNFDKFRQTWRGLRGSLRPVSESCLNNIVRLVSELGLFNIARLVSESCLFIW